jgi:hypothetical protein
MKRYEFPLLSQNGEMLLELKVTSVTQQIPKNDADVAVTLGFTAPWYVRSGGEIRIRLREGQLILEFI